MGFLTNIERGIVGLFGQNNTVNLSANSDDKIKNKKGVLPWELKTVCQSRTDIQSWKKAVVATSFEEPLNYHLQLIYKNQTMLDSLLISQIGNRINKSLSAKFSLRKPNGEIDEVQTAFLRSIPTYRKLTKLMLESIYFGYSLTELQLVKHPSGKYYAEVISIPRTNVTPINGRFYKNYLDSTSFINYKQLSEYGTYILEFDTDELGLLNNATPDVIIKKFSKSCWSELGEIYGIPPRVLKTNTQDKAMLNRAQAMMKDSGAAAWYILDESEKMEWAQAVNTNGDVFNNLISLCNNENSMLISGAIIGQDTKNGSKGKEISSQEVLDDLVEADLIYCAEEWNTKAIPALKKLGIITGDVTISYDESEDLDALWTRTKESFPFLEVDPEFVETKFGVKNKGSKQLTYKTFN